VVKARASGHDPLVQRWYVRSRGFRAGPEILLVIINTRRSRRFNRSLGTKQAEKKVADPGMGQEPRAVTNCTDQNAPHRGGVVAG
jgi:hypothetical protein